MLSKHTVNVFGEELVGGAHVRPGRGAWGRACRRSQSGWRRRAGHDVQAWGHGGGRASEHER